VALPSQPHPVAALPAGTPVAGMSAAGTPAAAPATFLMTDIEGSTRLWEEHPQVMPGALEAHDAFLRAAVEAHGGTIFKTTGDGLLARFEDPAAAVAATLAGQRALGAHAWPTPHPVRVRMALHAGTAQARDNDYFGPALNRVARLLAIGHGGQVLLSAAAASLVAGRLPPGVILLDRGDHRLRDLEQPERVFELGAPDLPADFPPLRSLALTHTNLPVQVTSFVGRERELAAARRLLETHRVVTLIGVGGTGKTRLMLQVAAESLDRHRDGAWVAELAPVGDPSLVAAEVARALGVGEQPGGTAAGSLVDFLRAKDLLLLLDNCEHVIDAAATLAAELVAGCPSLTVLASSREALGVPGEAVLQVPSLGVPRPREVDDPRLLGARPVPDLPAPERFAELAAAEAVRLFAERASAVLPSFQLTPDNAEAVVEICRRLDGIPLAIELAAARVGVLSVGELVQRLDDRFRLLTGGRRTAVPRQQTLQALIDWSWDLLDDGDRRLLRRVAVFAGGWTLDAATAVCTAPDEGAPDSIATLDALERLAERSMIVVDHGEATRYRLLETIRQYARDRLIESGEADDLRARHLAWCLDLSRGADTGLSGPELVGWLRRLDAEADNIRAAIEWGLDADPEAAARLCVAIWLHWRLRSWGLEGWATLNEAARRLRALPPATDPAHERERKVLLSRLLTEAAFTEAAWASADKTEVAIEAVALAREAGDERALAAATAGLWTAKFLRGEPDGLDELGAELISRAERADDPFTLAMARTSMAMALWATEPGAAERHLEIAIEVARRSGNPFAVAFTALAHARMLGTVGRIDEATALFDEAAATYEELGDSRFALVARSDLAHALRQAGRTAEARAQLRRTIGSWVYLGSRAAIAHQLESFAFLDVGDGDGERAARLLGTAEALREAADARMLPYERAEYDEAVARLREILPAPDLDRAWAAGRATDVAAAVSLAAAD
jgi:predicted ATPase/class 3 adenylate cyclase